MSKELVDQLKAGDISDTMIDAFLRQDITSCEDFASLTANEVVEIARDAGVTLSVGLKNKLAAVHTRLGGHPPLVFSAALEDAPSVPQHQELVDQLKAGDIPDAMINAILRQDIASCQDFASLTANEVVEIAEGAEIKLTVGLKKKLAAVHTRLGGHPPLVFSAALAPSVPQQHQDPMASLPPAPPLAAAAFYVNNNSNALHRAPGWSTTPPPAVRPDYTPEPFQTMDEDDSSTFYPLPRNDHDDDDVADVFPEFAARNPGSARPLVLPSELTIHASDPTYGYLDSVLRASGYSITKTSGAKKVDQVVTFTHPTHSQQGGFTGFVITSEARDLLRSLGDKRVGVLSAVGPARQGKSTLLSQVLQRCGYPNATFRSSASSDSCTMGIWAWPELLELGDGAKWLVLDVEGFFATDRNNGRSDDPDYFARLFGLTSLLSSVVVFFRRVSHAITSEDLRTLQDIGSKMEAFRRGSKDLEAAMRNNQRPFLFIATQWSATGPGGAKKKWDLAADQAYWDNLPATRATQNFINSFASEFRFVTLPNFDGTAEPENLHIQRANVAYAAKFEALMQTMLNPLHATSRFHVNGVDFSDCAVAWEAQLDTLVDAFSTKAIEISTQKLRQERARYRVEKQCTEAFATMETLFAAALEAAENRPSAIDDAKLREALSNVVKQTVFDSGDLEASGREPAAELEDRINALLKRVDDAMNREVARRIELVKLGDVVKQDAPHKSLELVQMAFDTPRAAELFNQRCKPALEAVMDTLEQAEWTQVLANVTQVPTGAPPLSIEECSVQQRANVLKLLDAVDFGSHPLWLRERLVARCSQHRVEVYKSLAEHAQSMGEQAVQRCWDAAGLTAIPAPQVTVEYDPTQRRIKPTVSLVFAKQLVPASPLQIDAFQRVPVAPIADDIWREVWSVTVAKLTEEVKKKAAPAVRYALVRISQGDPVSWVHAPTKASESYHVVDKPDGHVVALAFDKPADAAKVSGEGLSKAVSVPVPLHVVVAEAHARGTSVPALSDLQQVVSNVVLLHAVSLPFENSVALFYVLSAENVLPSFPQGFAAGVLLNFYAPTRVDDAAAPLPPDAVVLIADGPVRFVYHPSEPLRRLSEKPPVEKVEPYDPDMYSDAARFEDALRRGPDLKHRYFCPKTWHDHFKATKEQQPPPDWKDAALCGLRNVVQMGTIASLQAGMYYVRANNQYTPISLISDKAPTFEMVKTTELSDLPLPRATPAQIHVVVGDTLKVAQQLLRPNDRPLVLNMANTFNFGGGYAHGRGAQEEEIFRRTSYHLLQREAQSAYPMGPFDVHIARDVVVFREGEAEGYAFIPKEQQQYTLDFIGAAAFDLNLKHVKTQQLPPTPDNKELSLVGQDKTVTKAWAVWTARKIRGLLHTAAKYGYKTLVLGALGTGAFYNPVPDVIELFKAELACYGGYFTNITFAINDSKKADEFKQGLCGAMLFPPPSLKSLSVREALCPYGGLCQQRDDLQHSTEWHHPLPCESCHGAAAAPARPPSLVHQTIRSHVINCRYYATCNRTHEEAHMRFYKHAPPCTVPNCLNDAPEHLATYLHLPLCNKGYDCTQREDIAHNAQYRHVQSRCKYDVHCRAFLDPQHMHREVHPFLAPCPQLFGCSNKHPDHLKACSHLCEWGGSCSKIKDADHVKLHIHLTQHACRDGAKCTKMNDEEHLDTFSHPDVKDFRPPCKHGADCSERRVEKHVKEYSHAERKLTATVNQAKRGSQLGATQAQAPKYAPDRRIPYFTNVARMIDKVRKHWRGAPDKADIAFQKAVAWVDSFVPVHRCKSEVLAAMSELGAAVSKDEMNMMAVPELRRNVIQRFAKINPRLAKVVHRFPNQSEVVLNYAIATVCHDLEVTAQSRNPMMVQNGNPMMVQNLNQFLQAAPQNASTSTVNLQKLKTDQAEAETSLQQLPPHDAGLVKEAVKAMSSACAGLISVSYGIGYSVDVDVGTDNTVFSILGPHNGNYGPHRIVFRREAMHLFNFYMLPHAATFFSHQHRRKLRPWEDADSQEALLHSKLHPATPDWSTALALDICARSQKATYDAIKNYYRSEDSHHVIEGHLPQSLSLDYVYKAIVIKSDFNSMSAAAQQRVRDTFGHRLVLVSDDKEAVAEVKKCFSPESMDRVRRGFLTSLLANRAEEVLVPQSKSQRAQALHLKFRFRGSSIAIVLSDALPEAAAKGGRRACFTVSIRPNGTVVIAATPADAMNADESKWLAHRNGFFSEDPSKTVLHVWITASDKEIRVMKWGPTEVRNTHGRSVSYTGAVPRDLQYASVIADSNVELWDVEMPLRPWASCLEPSAANAVAVGAAAAQPAAAGPAAGPAAAVVGVFKQATEYIVGAFKGKNPCTGVIGACPAYTGNPADCAQHIKASGKHRCRWGAACRELNNPAHTADWDHVTLPPCANGGNCTSRDDPAHRVANSHPGLWDGMIPCKFGAQCREKTVDAHRLKYSHR